MTVKEKVSYEAFCEAVIERLKLNHSTLEKDQLWVSDIGISSVDLVKIIMLIRQKFGIKVPTSTIGKIKTVHDTYKLVEGE